MRITLTYNEKPAPIAGAALGQEQDDRYEEFDSPETAQAIAAVLRKLGHEVEPVLADRELPLRLATRRPDFVFNIAEGFRGRSREALVPALCELLEIPYTGSDPLTLAVTLDKAMAKRILAGEILTPRWFLVESLDDVRHVDLPFPAIVKPNCEGSSKGIRQASRVTSAAELFKQVSWALEQYQEPVLVEEFIAGPEVTVGVLTGPTVIGAMEIVPRLESKELFLYSLEVKRDWQRRVEYCVPPRLPPSVQERLHDAARRAFKVLGCRDVSRFDFRVGADGQAFFLEVNPLPGLNPTTGDIVILSRASGLGYDQLVQRILESAVARCAAR
ncbi:MAG: ATP-grasp domain-containing protein [Planctomycetota bacterium]